MDVNAPYRAASWLAYGDPGEIDPIDIAKSAELPVRMDDLGLESNFLVRARTTGGLVCDCTADVDGNGTVDFADLLRLLVAWGPCSECPEDLDESGAVDFGDILVVLQSWGPCV